jgi:sugar phosphate isomerase/epimerase
MPRVKIGLSLPSLGVPFRRALLEAQKLAVSGVELDATGDFAPRSLSQTGRRELRHLLRSHNLDLTAIGCPLRRGLDVSENQQQRIDHVREVLGLAFDLGPRLVVVPASKVPEKEDDPRAVLMKEAMTALGQHGDRVGAILALESGLDSGAALERYLSAFDSGSLAACFNPGSLLIGGHDPAGSARAMGQRLVYAHATDARYAGAAKGVREVPLGHGDIDWLQLLATLEEIGYHGWLVVGGDSGANALVEAAAGVRFLRRLVGS